MQELFYKGQYKQLLAATVDSADGAFGMPDLPFVIGALTFRGRLHEAQHLFKIHQGALDCQGLVVARFFLGVGYCRHSSYAQARQFFAANLRDLGRNTQPRARFYAWQGLGFYRLFCGRHRNGFHAAQKALEAALEANFLYGKALASDLMAHNQVLPGQVSAALGSFRDAIRYAELLGDGGLLQAFRVSLAIHSAQFGLAPKQDLDELRVLCDSIASQDNYSKSRLLLEIGRQLTLRGASEAAKTALNEACQLIYGSNNRRYGILLNLRYAFLMHLSGEQHQALNLLRNAAKELDPEVDRALAAEVIGLERRILRLLGGSDVTSSVEPAFAKPGETGVLTRLSSETGRVISLRILARERPEALRLARFGDDPLGDLLDLACLGDHSAATAIVDKGFYGLLLQLIPDAIGARALYFDLVPGSLVIVDRGSVRYCSAGFSSVIRALAKALGPGEASKQDLIETVWGYRYQSLKHDALIYRNVSRFRALLGLSAHWLEVTESGYRLSDGVRVCFHDREGAPRDAAVAVATGLAGRRDLSASRTPALDTAPPAVTATGGAAAAAATVGVHPLEGVNYRQLRILEALEKQDFLDVKACTQLFEVSEMTARRDLLQLFKLNLVQRIGKGRATRYGALTKRPPA